MTERVDLSAVLAKLNDFWSPLTVTTVNDYDVRVVKIPAGEFTRHCHPETDEFFLVLKGSIVIRMDDGDVPLGTGQVYVVSRGIHHQPTSEHGAEILLFEPSTTTNTGDTPSKLTAERKLAETQEQDPPRRDSRDDRSAGSCRLFHEQPEVVDEHDHELALRATCCS